MFRFDIKPLTISTHYIPKSFNCNYTKLHHCSHKSQFTTFLKFHFIVVLSHSLEAGLNIYHSETLSGVLFSFPRTFAELSQSSEPVNPTEPQVGVCAACSG